MAGVMTRLGRLAIRPATTQLRRTRRNHGESNVDDVKPGERALCRAWPSHIVVTEQREHLHERGAAK